MDILTAILDFVLHVAVNVLWGMLEVYGGMIVIGIFLLIVSRVGEVVGKFCDELDRKAKHRPRPQFMCAYRG